MTIEEAVEYCYEHESEFKRDCFDAGEDGDEQFECLISCLKSGHIRPNELADYGMEY